MTKDEHWMDQTMDKLRSQRATSRDLFSKELEERIMKEFETTPQRQQRRLVLVVAMAALVTVGTVGGVAVGAYQNEIRDWFYGALKVEANGEVRDEDGNLIGRARRLSEKEMKLQLQGESFTFEVEGDGKLPAAPFTVSIDPSIDDDQRKAADSQSFSFTKDDNTPPSPKSK